MPIAFITFSQAYPDRANFSFATAAGNNNAPGITKGASSLPGALYFPGCLRSGGDMRRIPQRAQTHYYLPDFMGRLRFTERRGAGQYVSDPRQAGYGAVEIQALG